MRIVVSDPAHLCTILREDFGIVEPSLKSMVTSVGWSLRNSGNVFFPALGIELMSESLFRFLSAPKPRKKMKWVP